MPSALCFVVLASLVTSTPLPTGPVPRAQQVSDAPTLHALEFDWTRDGILAGGSAVVLIASESVFKGSLAPKVCRWCDRSPDGTDTLNALDRWGRGVAGSSAASRKGWDTASNVTDYGVLPVGVLGAQYLLGAASGAPPRFFAEDTTMIVESVAVAGLVNQVVKFTVARERPFVHVLDADQKGQTDHPNDNNVSFYSGHTSLAFSLVTAAGTVSELRGYKNSWIIWAVGLPAAASVGLMRMGADKHYLTDVLVGAAAGSLLGVGMPLLLHARRTVAQQPSTDLSMRMTGGLGGISLSGVF